MTYPLERLFADRDPALVVDAIPAVLALAPGVAPPATAWFVEVKS